MPGKCSTNSKGSSPLEAELYFLIAKFLESGPCSESAQILRREIEEHKLVPKRLDWLGNEHNRTFLDLERSCPHIAPSHLLQICSSIGSILDKEIPPNVSGLQTLLGAGRQSLLRKKEDYQKPVHSVCTLASQRHGAPVLPSNSARSNYPPNITQMLVAREQTGFTRRSHTLSTKFYGRQQMYRRLLGHLSSVYCALFDRTGRYIFTGADDLLVKIWSAKDGRLLATLRGHSAEITDIAVNYENTLIAAASCDKIIRVWCLKTLAPVAVLVGHTGIVTALRFCPYARGDKRFLISTGNDGSVCFWQWSIRSTSFNPKPLKYTERNKVGAQMVCASFSPGGIFLATGSTDHHVRVYNILGFNGPEKICELEAHTDRVDSLQFSSNTCSFITGSKDGTAMIWRYERQQWRTILLKMSTKMAGSASEEPNSEELKQKFKVTMVGWSSDDSVVFTAVNDHCLKVWDSYTGQLKHVLMGHEDEVFVLETHPTDPRILLSGGHDGRIILWDVITGTIIKSFFNVIEGQGHGAVFDCKFSPDGMIFASTDSHGHLSIFGYGANDNYKKVPEEQYFHTDYRPLIRDANHHVLDEQTQCAPHLMPPPFLVDIDGNPYSPNLQRLVPGRENCVDSQLIPYIAVSADGDAEILEPVRPFEGQNGEHRPTIDDMIVRLQQVASPEHNGSSDNNNRGSDNSNRGHVSPRPANHRLPAGHSPGHSRVGMRRDGDIEGVRQSSGNWQSRGAQAETPTWVKRTVIKTNPLALRQDVLRRQALGDQELSHYNKEKKKRPNMEMNLAMNRKSPDRNNSKRKRKLLDDKKKRSSRGTGGTSNDRVRNARSHMYGEDYEDPDEISLSTTDSSISNDPGEAWYSSEHSESDSGDYSDWTEEAGVSVGTSSKPPRYSHRKKGRTSEEEEEERRKQLGESEGRERSRREARRAARAHTSNGTLIECPPEFRPPEWLIAVVPNRAPYVPQVGDQVVYFWQGHELYVQAVKRSRVYEINMKSLPWKKLKLREHEVIKITNISYEICPPRLCCLTVRILDPATGRPTGDDFIVRYHDMPDVIDFMVLRQVYDQSIAHNWKAGDRFRSLIDNAWWLGSIEQQIPLHNELPDSMFQCFLALWDNGETEKMSPWDFEPVDENRFPSNLGGSVEVTRDERQSMMYIPAEEEWPRIGRDEECDRLISALEHVMKLPFGKPFATAVDLTIYPKYAMVVELPVDLGMIKARLVNKYYRRIDAVKFDLSYIQINARKFNERNNPIVKQARLVTNLCLDFIKDTTGDDIEDLYQQMMENRQSRSTESDSEGISGGASSSHYAIEETAERRSGRKRKMNQADKKRMRLESQQYTSKSWKEQCLSFVDLILECEDSTPFRHPVNLADYPDYRNIIDHPMDLSTVKEKLQDNQYRNPVDLCKEMRLIFQNSRNYNTNKKSRIYSMTIRLSAMFEEQIRGIISDWRSAVKYEEKLKNNQFVSSRRRPVAAADCLSTSKKKPSSSGNRRSDPANPLSSKRLLHRNGGRASASSSGGGASTSHRNGGPGASSSSSNRRLKHRMHLSSSVRRGTPSSRSSVGGKVKSSKSSRKHLGNFKKRHSGSKSGSSRSSRRLYTNGITVPKKNKMISDDDDDVDVEATEPPRKKVSSRRHQNPQLVLRKKIKRAISMTNGGMHTYHQPQTRSKTTPTSPSSRSSKISTTTPSPSNNGRRRTVVNYRELDEGIDHEELEDFDDQEELEEVERHIARTTKNNANKRRKVVVVHHRESETEVSSASSNNEEESSPASHSAAAAANINHRNNNSTATHHSLRSSLKKLRNEITLKKVGQKFANGSGSNDVDKIKLKSPSRSKRNSANSSSSSTSSNSSSSSECSLSKDSDKTEVNESSGGSSSEGARSIAKRLLRSGVLETAKSTIPFLRSSGGGVATATTTVASSGRSLHHGEGTGLNLRGGLVVGGSSSSSSSTSSSSASSPHPHPSHPSSLHPSLHHHHHSDSNHSSSNTDGISDEDGGNTRRSSRTSTQNNTRATRSALHPNMIRVELKPPSKLGRMQTRNRGQRTVLYQEDSENEYEDRAQRLEARRLREAAHRAEMGLSTNSESSPGENDMNEDEDELVVRDSSLRRGAFKRARVLFSD